MCAVVFVSSSFMGYIFVTRKVVNVCRYCVSDPFVFAGYIFVTREFGVENIDEGLQMSYNLCNLPKKITAANGTSVKYTYFADGTKCWKSATLVQLYSFVFFTTSLQLFSCYIVSTMCR